MSEGAPAEPRSAPRSSEPAPAATSSAGAPPATNFEYDDNEWDVGIGDLIIDLDADIEKNNDAAPTAACAADQRMGVRQQHSSSMEKGLKMKIKRTSKPGRSSEAKHEIVQVDNKASAAAGAGVVESATAADAIESPAAKAAAKAVGKRALHKKERRDKEAGAVKAERQENGVGVGDEDAVTVTAGEGEGDSPAAAPSPQAKRHKTDAPTQGVSDMCVGTDGLISQGTLLEPDSLGPCEPGTTVNLEGIVWQETQGGVLVVNVTWRGKTYVGTLLDYTRHHDWAPPRFNDSPTAELESRSGKGRGKRGRGAGSAPEPSVAETRASVQSKLRSQSKGRRSTANSVGASFTAPASPVKRKGRAADREVVPADKTPNKRSRTGSYTGQAEPGTPEPAAPSPPSPTIGPPRLIVCPETGCSKKYRNVNGLRYHQSHAHSSGLSEGERETGESSAPESPPAVSTPPAARTPPAAPASPLPVTSAAAPATSPVTPATPAPAAPPLAASAPPSGAAAPAKPDKPAGPVPAAVAPQAVTRLPGPPPAAAEPPAAEPRPTHAKVHISDSSGNVKTSGVLRFGPTVAPAGTAAPLRTAASVYQPTGPPPASAPVTVSPATRTVPVPAADPARYKPKSVAARGPAAGLPVVTVPPATGTYGQAVSHLKPIQPKPTILGETSLNPALEALRKEKERPRKRRKENGVRTPEASPRPDGAEPARPAARPPAAGAAPSAVTSSAMPTIVSSAVTGVVSSAAPGAPVAAPVGGPGAPPAAASGAPVRPPGAAERPSRDGTASPAYSDISDDGAPVDAAGRPAPGADKKELAGPLPPSSVYYHSFFQPPGVYVSPPTAGKPGAGPDGADGKEGPRGPPGEYPGGQVPYYPYPYLPASYPYPPMDPAGYPLPVLVDPKFKAAAGAGGPDRRDAASDGESGRTSAPPAEPRAASGRNPSPQPAPRPAPAAPSRPGGPPVPVSTPAKRPPATSAAGPPASAADKRPGDAAALAARAAAFGYPPFGLPGLTGLPYGPVLLNGGYPARFPVSSAGGPEDLSRSPGPVSSRAGDAPSARAAAHRLLEGPDRQSRTAAGSASPSAAGRTGSPASPLRAPLPAGLGFPPPAGYTPFPGVPGPGPAPGFAPIK